MPVYNKRGILLLPKVIVLNPKDGSASADSRARQRGVHESEFKPAGFGKFIPVSAGFLLSKTVQTSRDPTENALAP